MLLIKICVYTYVIDPLWSTCAVVIERVVVERQQEVSGKARVPNTQEKHMLSSVRYLSTLLASNAQRQTIYALSTPPGKGGVAVVRVSGPDARVVWDNMVRSYKPNKPIKNPIPWKLHRCCIVHPKSKSLIDDGLAVYFQGNLDLDLPFFSTKNNITIQLHIHIRHTRPLNYTFTPEERWSQLYSRHYPHYQPSDLQNQVNSLAKLS